MKLATAFLFSCTCSFVTHSAELSSFVPKGWNIILSVEGDLNKDGMADKVLIIEDNDPKNIILNDGLGQDTLNVNPRAILVLFQNSSNEYSLADKNDNGFIPSQDDEESTCLADPLMQEGSVNIEKGLLKINFNYWLSCGSWYVNDAIYTFRYQNGAFELIGYDHSDFHRASGEASSSSYNFSTRRKSETTGMNQFEDATPKTIWSKIKSTKVFKLSLCNSETYFELSEI